MKNLLIGLFFIMSLSSAAFADDGDDRIVLGVHRYHFYAAPDARDAARLDVRLGSIHIWKFHPWIGGEIGEKGESFVGAGIETDIDLTDHIYTTIQSGPGYFDDGNDNSNYDYYPPSGFKIRTQLELGYKFDNAFRLSTGYTHTSNAGISYPNPGGNQLGINLHVPFSAFTH